MMFDKWNGKAGDSFDCPACGQVSLVKVTTKMAGWTAVGQVFTCAMCGHELGPVTSQEKTETVPADASIDRLADFLGETPQEPVKADDVLGVSEDLDRFCKNCHHFYRHPFMDKCLFHQRPADPMGDCPDFTPAPRENETP
ncbi:MAG: hypothetical protein RRC34_04700 [Lentisphaeria bacterium]|nr:hypothetical protein [Lentisphaeria bacterium]